MGSFFSYAFVLPIEGESTQKLLPMVPMKENSAKNELMLVLSLPEWDNFWGRQYVQTHSNDISKQYYM